MERDVVFRQGDIVYNVNTGHRAVIVGHVFSKEGPKFLVNYTEVIDSDSDEWVKPER